MKLSQRLPSFPSSERVWRKFFSRSSKHSSSDKTSANTASSSLPPPSLVCSTVAAPQTYNNNVPSTPRASSEYASSTTGGLPDDDDDLSSLESSTSSTSPWNSSIPESPSSSSKRFSMGTTLRPPSVYSSFQRSPFAEDIEEEPSCIGSRVQQGDDQLILTMTSKYPTGAAADNYVPVDVSMPFRSNAGWRMGNRPRPSSVLISRPSLLSRTSSKNKRMSMHGQLYRCDGPS